MGLKLAVFPVILRVRHIRRGKPVNANQVMNMIMRIIMRKAVNKSINVGVNRVTRSTRGRSQTASHGDMDIMDEGVQTGPTQAQIRKKRRQARAAQQVRQAAKVGRRPT